MIQKKVKLSQNNPIAALNVSDSVLIDLIIDSIQDVKGKKIVKLDLNQLDDSPTDHFIICEGGSTTQLRAIIDNIQKRVKEELKITPAHVEGGGLDARWVLIDYFSIVVHVFYPETREYYNLEDLWKDAEITQIPDLD